MIDINLNGEEPKHVERIPVMMDTDAAGNIRWTPSLLDHDVSQFYRGKQVTNEEFNELFLKNIYQGNYIVDSLVELFNTQLNNSISKKFRSTYNLTTNFIKTFLTADWGTIGSDGYYKIEIPASEHGFEVDTSDTELHRMNISVEMYVLKNDANFYIVDQFDIDTLNTVTLYTDDNTLCGFVVIKDNNKSFSLTEGTITTSQVTGLDDALDALGTRLSTAEENIGGIRSGNISVGHAEEADHADDADTADDAGNVTDSIANMPLDNIFETGSRNVKQATRAKYLSELTSDNNTENYVEAGSSTQPVYFSGGLPVAITGALANDITGNAATATKVTGKINDQNITDIIESDGLTAKKATKAKLIVDSNNQPVSLGSKERAIYLDNGEFKVCTDTTEHTAGTLEMRYSSGDASSLSSISFASGRKYAPWKRIDLLSGLSLIILDIVPGRGESYRWYEYYNFFASYDLIAGYVTYYNSSGVKKSDNSPIIVFNRSDSRDGIKDSLYIKNNGNEEFNLYVMLVVKHK